MAVWPGGPCPSCGADVPARVVRCHSCQHLLNAKLQAPAAIQVPEYQPLPELTSCPRAVTRGVYMLCPACDRELRINNKYRNQRVSCKYCTASFLLDLSQSMTEAQAYIADCPHCHQELRASPTYLGQKVACKFCSEPLQLVDPPDAQETP